MFAISLPLEVVTSVGFLHARSDDVVNFVFKCFRFGNVYYNYVQKCIGQLCLTGLRNGRGTGAFWPRD